MQRFSNIYFLKCNKIKTKYKKNTKLKQTKKKQNKNKQKQKNNKTNKLKKKPQQKIIERGKIDTSNTQIHYHSLSWLGTGTSITSGGVTLV